MLILSSISNTSTFPLANQMWRSPSTLPSQLPLMNAGFEIWPILLQSQLILNTPEGARGLSARVFRLVACQSCSEVLIASWRERPPTRWQSWLSVRLILGATSLWGGWRRWFWSKSSCQRIEWWWMLTEGGTLPVQLPVLLTRGRVVLTWSSSPTSSTWNTTPLLMIYQLWWCSKQWASLLIKKLCNSSEVKTTFCQHLHTLLKSVQTWRSSQDYKHLSTLAARPGRLECGGSQGQRSMKHQKCCQE